MSCVKNAQITKSALIRDVIVPVTLAGAGCAMFEQIEKQCVPV